MGQLEKEWRLDGCEGHHAAEPWLLVAAPFTAEGEEQASGRGCSRRTAGGCASCWAAAVWVLQFKSVYERNLLKLIQK